MSTEILYLGRDNTIDLKLKADGSAVDLTNATKITASFDDTLISSTNKATGAITWDQEGYETGEIRLDLGAEDIDEETYTVPIIVYDAVNTNGIEFGTVIIKVVWV